MVPIIWVLNSDSVISDNRDQELKYAIKTHEKIDFK